MSFICTVIKLLFPALLWSSNRNFPLWLHKNNSESQITFLIYAWGSTVTDTTVWPVMVILLHVIEKYYRPNTAGSSQGASCSECRHVEQGQLTYCTRTKTSVRTWKHYTGKAAFCLGSYNTNCYLSEQNRLFLLHSYTIPCDCQLVSSQPYTHLMFWQNHHTNALATNYWKFYSCQFQFPFFHYKYCMN